MHLLLVFFFLSNAFVISFAMPAFLSDSSPNLAIYPSRRSLITIIRSCFSTIFVCAWVSVHPNIPPNNQGQAKALWRRLKMMFWAIVAPELILAWAVRQWLAARKIRDTFNQVRKLDQTWTMEHGHFLAMGGYILIDSPIINGSPKSKVLSYGLFEELVQDPEFNFPPLSLAEIQDKSKGDFLAKAIAILQTSWFIIECIVRATQGLAITELELVTLALASLNAITYFFWWHKPLGVQEPVRVYLKPTPGPQSTILAAGQDITVDSTQQEISDVSLVQILTSTRKMFSRMKDATFTRRSASPLDKKSYLTLCLQIIRFPVFFFFFFTFPIVAWLPLALAFILWMFKVGPPPPPLTLRFPLFFYLLDVFWRSAPYIIKHGVRDIFLMCLDAIQHPDNILIPLLVWFFAIPTLFFVSVIIFLIYFPISLAVIGVMYVVFSSIFELLATASVNASATHVPAFYAPNTKNDHYSRVIVFAFFGITFGGIHCVAWNFVYPTRFEQILWRVTSLLITVVPIFAAPLAFLLSNAQQSHNTTAYTADGTQTDDQSEKDFVFINRSNASGFVSFRSQMRLQKLELAMILGDFIMTVLLFVYVPARVLLIGQALLLLRAQPQSAFIDIDWTKFIPHV